MIKQFLFLTLIIFSNSIAGMEPQIDIETLTKKLATSSITPDPYDSDSEDEDGPIWSGYQPLNLSEEFFGSTCIALFRGAHFSQELFSKANRSRLRRNSQGGIPLFSMAAYKLCSEKPNSIYGENSQLLTTGLLIRNKIIDLNTKQREEIQKKFSNDYNGFIEALSRSAFVSSLLPEINDIPFVSFSELARHPAKYGFGIKFLPEFMTKLNPLYDSRGKPRHPYLGIIYVALCKVDLLDELDPYFVVAKYKGSGPKINFRILYEREVSIPGFIPGKYIIYSIPLKTPSFEKPYKEYYLEKYGLKKESYLNRQRRIQKAKSKKDREKIATNLIKGVLIPHITTTLEAHIKEECKKMEITLVYKNIDGFAENPIAL